MPVIEPIQQATILLSYRFIYQDYFMERRDPVYNNAIMQAMFDHVCLLSRV